MSLMSCEIFNITFRVILMHFLYIASWNLRKYMSLISLIISINCTETLLAIIAKYGTLINDWDGLYYAVLEVSLQKIALWKNVCVDDWTVPVAIIASNVTILMKSRSKVFFVTLAMPFRDSFVKKHTYWHMHTYGNFFFIIFEGH